MNAFTSIAIANRAPLLTDMHLEEPLLKVRCYEPESELPLIVRYRGEDAVEKAAEIAPPALLFIIGEIKRSVKSQNRRRPALVIEAQDIQVIPREAVGNLSMSLSWEVQSHSFAGLDFTFIEADDEDPKPRRF